MKILIDISQAVYGTGVSVYTKELTRALLRVAPENNYVLYAGVLRKKRELDEYIKGLHGEFKLVTLLIPPRVSDILWNYTSFIPLEFFTGKVDVVHVSDWTEPFTRAPKVTTIHDLSPILYPEVTHPRIRRVFSRKMSLIKNNNDLVIVPSLSIAKDVISYGISSKRVHVIPEAPNPELVISYKLDVKKRFGITNRFVLMIGTAGRKNIYRSIEAFLSLKLKDTQLVIVGERGDLRTQGHQILYTGFVSIAELSSLYKEAELFLYPSLYEGFGLPILEAYLLGCPVVTSNSGSMQEVGGGAVLVNAFDTRDIAQGIKKAISERKSLVSRGKKIVKSYSWEKTARETLLVYQKAYAEK